MLSFDALSTNTAPHPSVSRPDGIYEVGSLAPSGGLFSSGNEFARRDEPRRKPALRSSLRKTLTPSCVPPPPPPSEKTRVVANITVGDLLVSEARAVAERNLQYDHLFQSRHFICYPVRRHVTEETRIGRRTSPRSNGATNLPPYTPAERSGRTFLSTDS